MSYQSFRTINDALPLAVRSNFARAVIQAQSSADALVSVATSTVSEYARLYSQVQRLKYDTAGNVTDVTPADELTVPQSAIATLKASVNDLEKLMNWYNTMPDTVSVEAEAVIPSTLVGANECTPNRIFDTWALYAGTNCVALSDVVVTPDGNYMFCSSYYAIGARESFRHYLAANTGTGCKCFVFTSDNDFSLPGLTTQVTQADYRYLWKLDWNIEQFQFNPDSPPSGWTLLTTLTTPILQAPVNDLLNSNYTPAGTKVDEIKFQVRAAEARTVQATFTISQALAAVLNPYQDLRTAVDQL